MEKLIKSGDLFKFLEMNDFDLAEKVKDAGCIFCDCPKLHCGNYSRKPRGGPSHWNERYSFCCSVCRKRNTPPSVRFLGRRVYIGVVVVLISAMMHGLNPLRVEKLRRELGIEAVTLQRWREWWLESFVEEPFWKEKRARFMPVPNAKTMPYCLIQRFHAGHPIGLIRLMKFLAPITTGSCREGVVM